MVKKAKDLYLRKIDIKSWDSDVAQQHNIRSLPHLILYGPEGQVLKTGRAAYSDIVNWENR